LEVYPTWDPVGIYDRSVKRALPHICLRRAISPGGSAADQDLKIDGNSPKIDQKDPDSEKG
jgi:hypothetical protein